MERVQTTVPVVRSPQQHELATLSLITESMERFRSQLLMQHVGFAGQTSRRTLAVNRWEILVVAPPRASQAIFQKHHSVSLIVSMRAVLAKSLDQPLLERSRNSECLCRV
jgi:hypothetical protein